MATLFNSIGRSLDYISNYSRTNDYESLQCVGTEDHYKAMQLMLIPAILIIIGYSFLIRRNTRWLDKLDGRPGVVYPISLLTHSERLSHAASFGVISALIFKMVFDSRQAIDYDGDNAWVKSLVTIGSTIIYGINCFPLFASVTLRNAVGYGVGTLYIWGFTVAANYSYRQCNLSGAAWTLYNIQNLPHYACLLYLALRLPYSFVMEILRWQKEGTWQKEKIRQTFQLLRESYQGRQVNKALAGITKVVQRDDSTIEGKVNTWCSRKAKEWIYEWDPNFQYSARILTTLWVSFLLIYMVTIKCAWSSTSLFLYVTDMAKYALDGIGWSDRSGDSQVEKLTRNLLKLYYYTMRVIWIFLIVTFVITFVIGFLSILYSLTAYRKNIRELYRGDYSNIRPKTDSSNPDHLVGSIRYAGYQIGYAAWGYFIQVLCIVLFVVALIMGIVILYLGFYDWLVSTIYSLGPWLIVFVVIILVQYLLARFVFLQDHATSLAIDNRRWLYVFSYFLFFYNAFVGIASCLVRLLRSLVTGLLLIARLDQSMLPRKYELSDPGYNRYLGFLYVEAYHTHPSVLVFIDLLKLSSRETRARMTLGPSFAVSKAASLWVKKKPKPANNVQNFLVSVVFGKKFLDKKDQNRGGKNKVKVIPADSSSDDNKISSMKEVPPDVRAGRNLPPSEGKGDLFQTSKSKTLAQIMLTGLGTKKGAKETTVQIEGPPTPYKGHDTSGGTWEMLRDSPQMKKYRRKQAAVFHWFLAYTLLTNPQLRTMRKGFLQKRMRDAEKGITGQMTDYY